MFSQISLVAFVCAIVDNVVNFHADHPISPKPSITMAIGKKVLVSLSSTQKWANKKSRGLSTNDDECINKLVNKPLSPCKATSTLVT